MGRIRDNSGWRLKAFLSVFLSFNTDFVNDYKKLNDFIQNLSDRGYWFQPVRIRDLFQTSYKQVLIKSVNNKMNYVYIIYLFYVCTH